MTSAFPPSRIPADRFLPLPVALRGDGEARKTGFELEFGKLTEAQVADVIVETLGGHIHQPSDHTFQIEDTRIGEIEVILDTALRKSASSDIVKSGLELSRAVVPVEIVSSPLSEDDLPQVEKLRAALRDAGASGSRDGLLLGFGVHLNPEMTGDDVADILPTLRAYALLEDWLRNADPIDPARRLLPFVKPYPRQLVSRLAHDSDGWSRDDLIDAYLDETKTRNHGLDMLPLFSHLDPDRVYAVMGEDSAISARPTYHYRLPDCRIDEDTWTLAYEWNRWCLVETVANTPALLDDLADRWASYKTALTTVPRDWRLIIEDLLAKHLDDGAFAA